MLEINNAALYQPGFVGLIQKLSKAEGLPAKTAYRVGKITQATLREYTTVDTKRLEILKKYVEKDETGAWKRDESGELVFSDRDAAHNEISALLSQSFQVDQLPVDVATLDAAKLTPEELIALEWLLKE